jgi:1-acyl-sn-glycerol-3-phosphate acyltransferase
MPVQWAAVALGRPLRRRIPVFYHRTMCALLGVRVRVVGAAAKAHPLLIVANHVSWLDISVITSAAPVVFVAKREIASWPFFGLLAKLQRSVFVDRERGHVVARLREFSGPADGTLPSPACRVVWRHRPDPALDRPRFAGAAQSTS